MAKQHQPRGSEVSPQVNPLGAIESLVGRLAAWARRVGETRVAYAVLALAFVLAAALILGWGRGQTFINDEWTYLVVDRGWSLETLLTPQNGHLIVLPLLVYKGLFSTVGADSHVPFQVTTVVLHLTVVLLFFQLVRNRLPLVAAVALAVLVTFFGAGWDTLMGAYELPNLTGMAAGLGMLLALERRTLAGDIAACVLLALALASFSVGVAFALGALLSIWLSGRQQWRRAWIVLVPAALYVAWFAWARKFGQSELTAEAASSLLSGIAGQLAAICAGISGLFRVPGSADLPSLVEIRPEWGYPLALVLIALVALHIRRAPRSVYFWTVAGTLLAYLALVAIGLSPARAPNASRYVYMGGILALLLIAELGRDIRWSTGSGLVALAIFSLALMANVAELRAGGRLFEAEGATNRATLTALELSRDRVDPAFSVEDGNAAHSHPDMFFSASAYFDATRAFGSPAFSIGQLLETGEQGREAADQELVRALGLAVKPVVAAELQRGGSPPKALSANDGRVEPLASCLLLIPDAGHTGSFQIELGPGGFSYRTAADAEVEPKLNRFGDAFSTSLPPVRGSGEVVIPVDASSIPWRVELTSAERTIACPR
jgi:hypothetical protein